MFNRIKDLFLDHPNAVGENYFTHMLFALKCAGTLWLLHVVCIIHAIFPFLFTRTVGNYLIKLSDEIKSKY
jgi:hypothetical protein